MRDPIHAVSDQYALLELVEDAGISSGPDSGGVYRDAVMANYLRSSLYGLSLSQGEGRRFTPVHTLRLTNSIRRHLQALWPELRRPAKPSLFEKGSVDLSQSHDHLGWHLERLSLLGDIVSLGNGYWLPAPVRVISLPSCSDVAIVGGLSTRALRQILPSVEAAGYGRLVPQMAPDDYTFGTIHSQEYECWIGWTPSNLRLWTEEQAHLTMREGSSSSALFIDFEVFVSSWELRRYGAHGWIPARALLAGGKADSVLLCRTGYPTRFFLGHFDGGQLKRERTILPEFVRWLQLGLMLQQGLAPLANWEGDYVRLFPLLPQPVERHFLVYAYALRPKPRQFKWYVPPKYRAHAEALLKRVGYRSRSFGGLSE